MMTTQSAFPDLVPAVRALSRADKLRLLQFLAGELAREEGVSLIEADIAYPIWTPHHAFEAAAVLLRELQAAGAAP